MRKRQKQARVQVKISDRSDPWIPGVTTLLVVCGMIFVLDTSYFFSSQNYNDGLRVFLKHVFSIGVGVVLLLVLSRLRSDLVERHALKALIASLALLALTLVPGVQVCANGACRWISLFGVFNFQPAELVKVAFVIYVVARLTQNSDKLSDLRKGILPVAALMGGIGVALLLQPDFGTAALLGVLALTLMFMAGVPLWQLSTLAALSGVAGYVLIRMEPYRIRRFACFLDPETDPLGVCWHLRQALMAFGSGQLGGQGLGASTQKSGWLPEAHTDFIFSVVGEETGLIGAVIVVVCFALFAYRGLRVAHRHPDMFGQMLAAGLTLIIVMQALLNMGVILGLLPTKGIGLPFISYGGSSMMVLLAATGLLMSLSRELRER